MKYAKVSGHQTEEIYTDNAYYNYKKRNILVDENYINIKDKK